MSGRVQGVGFRWFVQQAARRHGVEGDVKNMPDGRVEIRARGSAERLAALRGEVRDGPAASRVDELRETALEDPPEFEGFTVRH